MSNGALEETMEDDGTKRVEVSVVKLSDTAVEPIPNATLPKTKVEKSHEQAIVVLGEASESDEDEEEIMTDNSPTTPVGRITRMTLPLTAHYVQPSMDHRSPGVSDPIKCKSLLHTKLRERNAALRKRIIHAVQQPYQMTAKDLNNVSQQLVKTQSHLQELSPILRMLTNELFQLEDKLEITMDCSNLIPDIKIDSR